MFVLGWNLLRGRVGRALVAIRDQPIAAEAMGVNSALVQVARPSASSRCTPASPARSARSRSSSSRPTASTSSCRSLAGRHRGRRPGLDLRRALRRAVHPVRAQHRGPDLEGRALGDLRRVPDRLRLPDADRRRGFVRMAGRGCARRVRLNRRSDEATTMERHHASAARCVRWRLRACAAARRSRRRSTTRARPTPRSRSATPMPYSGPASAYGTIGKSTPPTSRWSTSRAASTAARSTSSSYDDGYSPPQDGGEARKLVEQDEVLSCSRPSARRPTPRSTST